MNKVAIKSAQIILEWLLLIAFGGLFCLHTLPNAWHTLNTDFPNYYLASQLAQQGADTSQAYDWRWFQRQKDQRQIDQHLVGLAPITPFSTLFIWPLVRLTPLEAKHAWLLFQLVLLGLIGLGLHALTGQSLRRLALLALLCFPLHRNLLYGQFYILLLALLVAACWAYARRLSVLAGALIAVAAMTKIFPIIFALYFLRKQDWRAFMGLVLTAAVCLAAVIPIYGWSIHRHYLLSVLPWTLRGEALPPFELATASFSSMLHRLLIFEPQWNPHPLSNAPLLAAVLAPLLQMAIIAPALLLIRTKSTPLEIALTALEWSTLLCAALTVSTSPASYDFVLLLLPLSALLACLLPSRPVASLLSILVFLGIGYPGWNTTNVDGARIFLHVPRLILLVAFTALCCWALTLHRHPELNALGTRQRIRKDRAWACAAGLLLTAEVIGGVRHQHDLYDDYRYRLPMPPGALLSAQPEAYGSTTQAISMFATGYRLTTLPVSQSSSQVGPSSEPLQQSRDELSFAPSTAGAWIEEDAGVPTLLPPAGTALRSIKNAHHPLVFALGDLAAYLRTEQGRAGLFGASGQRVSPATMNVLEAALLPDRSFLAAASERDGSARLYLLKPAMSPQPLALGDARYPAVSLDGLWLAYSRFDGAAWNLWLLDRRTHASRRLTDADCDQVEASWEADSKTLLYASDCGRALGFYAICRRKVIP